MEQTTGRKKTGKYIPDALTSSKRKNQSLGRTRHKREKGSTGQIYQPNSRKKFIVKLK